MADETIDIKIQDKIDRKVVERIREIEKAAIRGDDAVERLKKEMETMSGTPLIKLANATARLTNAMRMQKNATADLALKHQRLRDAHLRQENSSAALALKQQRLQTETRRTELATLRLIQAQRRLSKSSKQAGNSLSGFAMRFAAFAGVTTSGVALVSFADSFSNLQNKIRITTDSQAQLNAVTEELFEVANRSRVGVEGIGTAFQRFDLALEKTGASQAETLRITETFSKSLILGGASAQEASGALRQLSQSFNSGRLNGQEFNAIAEQAPIVLDGVAEAMGVTRGELKDLGAQGKITVDVLRRAFALLEDQVDSEFARTIPTISQSFVVLRNEAVRAIGKFEEATGVFETLARAVLVLANNFDLILVGLAGLSTLLLAAVIPSIKAFTLALFANPLTVLIAGLVSAVTYLAMFKDEIKLSKDGVISLGDVITVYMGYINDAVDLTVRFFKNAWMDAFRNSNTEAQDFKMLFIGAIDEIKGVIKTTVNFVIAWFVGLFNASKHIGISIRKLFTEGFSGIGEEFGKTLKTEFLKAFDIDYVGDAINTVTDAARKNANAVTVPGPQKPDLGAGRGGSSASSAAQYLRELREGLMNDEGGFSEVLTVGLGKIVEGYTNVLTELSDAFGNFFQSVTDGFADSIGRAIVMGEDLEKSLKRVAQNALAEMISALVKIGIQYLVNAAIGKSAMASTAAVGAGAAAATAAAWAPAAAATSLASFGANAAPATAGLTSTFATSQTLAAAGGLAGFKDGGYTGNYGRSEVAGVVHGQEFVMNAEATARNRPMLEAMNRGGSANTSPGVSITVENYGTSEISVEQVTPTDVRIIAREAAMKAVREEAPGVIAADISNPNSRVSRSLGQNTKTQRKR